MKRFPLSSKRHALPFGVALFFCSGCTAPAAPVSDAPRVLATPTPTASTAPTAKPVIAVEAKYEIVGTFPHDQKAFTEGLLFRDNVFYESTGLEGNSSVRRVDVKSGRVLAQRVLPREIFGEGLALANGELFQLSWQSGRCFVYDAKMLKPRREYSYQGEGWGLTFDGANLIQSDGSDTLTFRDPKTFQIVRTLRVMQNGAPLDQINELEWIDGEIWANIWHQDLIARIDPKTGNVTSYLDCRKLFSRQLGGEDVLNGIAYDAKTKRVFVTGKLWPKMFALRLKK